MNASNTLPKRFLVTLLSILAVMLAACGPAGSEQTPTDVSKAADDQQIYISPLGGYKEIKTFDPALAYDIPSISSIGMVFTGLVQLDNKLQVQDQLAASHSISEDGLTYTFTLKDGLKFSDGSPLTSKDVAYSIDRALQPTTESSTAAVYLGLIQGAQELADNKAKTVIGTGITTPDDKTVIIKITKKAAYFLYTLTYPCAYVIQKALIDKYGNQFVDHLNEGMGGAGPFKVSRYIRGQLIEFVPNENYYGPKPQLKKVVRPFYQESDTTYRAYQTDEVHTAGIPSSQIEQAKKLPDKQYHQSPLLWTYYFGMNYLTKPFDNIKIRQAFALAVNKDAISNSIFKGTVIPTNHIIPQGMVSYNEQLTGPHGEKGTAGNTTLAKQLFEEGMKEAGYTLANFPTVTMTYSSGGSADERNEMSAVQQMWKTALGIEIKANDLDSSTYFDTVAAAANNPDGIQMWDGNWVADYPDPQNWVSLLFNKGVSKNSMNYGQNGGSYAEQQQEAQNLMNVADANLNPDERTKQYQDIEQKLVNDVAWIPKYQMTDTYVRKPCVVGMEDNAQGLTPPNDWSGIYISTAQPCANVDKFK